MATLTPEQLRNPAVIAAMQARLAELEQVQQPQPPQPTDIDAQLDAMNQPGGTLDSWAHYTPQQKAYLESRAPDNTLQPAQTHFEAFKQGGQRGHSTIMAGLAQRGAQALNAAGIDMNDFLSDLALAQQAKEAAFKPTEDKYPITSMAGKIAGEVSAMPIPASTWKSGMAAGGIIAGSQYGTGEQPFWGKIFGDSESAPVQEFINNVILGAVAGGAAHKVTEKTFELAKAGIGKTKALVQSALAKTGRKMPDNLFNANGTLKPEAQAYFDQEDISEEFLSEHIKNEVNALPEGSDLKQAMRKAEARDLGVTSLTRGDITQDFDDKSIEFALSREAGTDEARRLRGLKADQNQELIRAGEDIAQGMGQPDPDKLLLGEAIQEGLRGSLDQRRKAISDLYDLAEQHQGSAIPIEQKGIAEAFADQDFIFGLDPDVGQFPAVRQQLEAFSVLPRDLLKEDDAWRIMPLTLRNSEKLRQRINSLVNWNDRKSVKALKPIIKAIDEAVDTLTITDDMGEAAAKAFKEGRKAAQEYAEDFEAKDIIQQIVSTKPGTQTDKIHASVVYNKIMGTQSRFQATQAVKKALLKGGQNDTWDNFKATAAAELIGKGLTTGKTATSQMKFSGKNFNNALKKIGNPTLETLFGPKELARLRQLARVSADLTIEPDGVFRPSTDIRFDSWMSKIAKSPYMRVSLGVRWGLEKAGEGSERIKRQNALERVLNPDTKVAQQLGGYSNAAINALRLMAISGQSQLRDNEDKK